MVLPFFFCQASCEKEAIRVFQVMFRVNMWRKRRDLPVQRDNILVFIHLLVKGAKAMELISHCAQLFEEISFGPKSQAKISTRGESVFFWRSYLQHFEKGTFNLKAAKLKRNMLLTKRAVLLCGLIFSLQGLLPIKQIFKGRLKTRSIILLIIFYSISFGWEPPGWLLLISDRCHVVIRQSRCS